MNKSRQAISVFDRRANDYQSKYMDVSGYHDTLNSFCNLLKPNASVLELACGPGNMTKYLLNERPDLLVMGTDLAPNMVALAKINNPSATFGLLDMRTIGKIDHKYDGLLCGFGLPYLSKKEVMAFINDLPRVVNRGGFVYLSTMEGDYQTSGVQKSSDGKDEIFIHFHEAGYLAAALEAAGFEIILKKNQEFPDNDDTDLIIIAKWNPVS